MPKLFKTDISSEADIKVFVSDIRSAADLIIYETGSEWETTESSNWFYTDIKSSADKIIYFTDSQWDADLVVFKTDIQSDAGWQDNSKAHLL